MHQPTVPAVPRRTAHLPVVALLVLAVTACSPSAETAGDGVDDSTPTAPSTAAPSTTTTVSAPPSTVYAPDTIEGQIEADYLAAWANLQRAIVEANPDLLPLAHTGHTLTEVTQQVNELIAEGLSARIDVDHDLTITLVGDGVAAVDSTYVNHSVTLHRDTGEPNEPDPNEVVTRTFTMHLENGTWKIFEIIEVGSSSVL